jgi:hypothetical protein
MSSGDGRLVAYHNPFAPGLIENDLFTGSRIRTLGPACRQREYSAEKGAIIISLGSPESPANESAKCNDSNHGIG